MLYTRRAVAEGLLMGIPAAGALEAGAAGQQRQTSSAASDREVADVADQLRDMVSLLRVQGDPPVIQRIREIQHVFLRANSKFPDYVEIGIGVWQQLYDWHIHTHQALSIGRVPDGRYGMQALMSTFVLRTDSQPDFIGQATDNL
jgi:hypothetical protein